MSDDETTEGCVRNPPFLRRPCRSASSPPHGRDMPPSTRAENGQGSNA